jgi:hypothetical protein
MEKEEMSSPRDIANNTDSGLAQLFVLHSGLLLELFGYKKTQQPKCHLTLPISWNAKPGSQIKLSILQEVLDAATPRVAPAGTEARL